MKTRAIETMTCAEVEAECESLSWGFVVIKATVDKQALTTIRLRHPRPARPPNHEEGKLLHAYEWTADIGEEAMLRTCLWQLRQAASTGLPLGDAGPAVVGPLVVSSSTGVVGSGG